MKLFDVNADQYLVQSNVVVSVWNDAHHFHNQFTPRFDLEIKCWCFFPKDSVQLGLVGVFLGTKLLQQDWEQDWELALEEVCFRVLVFFFFLCRLLLWELKQAFWVFICIFSCRNWSDIIVWEQPEQAGLHPGVNGHLRDWRLQHRSQHSEFWCSSTACGSVQMLHKWFHS